MALCSIVERGKRADRGRASSLARSILAATDQAHIRCSSHQNELRARIVMGRS